METTQITLNIPNSKLKFVLQLLNELGIKTDNNINIPQWQMDEVNESIAEYHKNPTIASNFDQAMDDIENEL